MGWSFNENEPVFVQIADRLRAEIISGAYASGEQIPPVRTLAMRAAVNPNTVQRALASLEDEGLLYSKGTLGRFVTEDKEKLLCAKEVYGRKTARKFLSAAHALGITTEELIEYIKYIEKETCKE